MVRADARVDVDGDVAMIETITYSGVPLANLFDVVVAFAIHDDETCHVDVSAGMVLKEPTILASHIRTRIEAETRRQLRHWRTLASAGEATLARRVQEYGGRVAEALASPAKAEPVPLKAVTPPATPTAAAAGVSPSAVELGPRAEQAISGVLSG